MTVWPHPVLLNGLLDLQSQQNLGRLNLVNRGIQKQSKIYRSVISIDKFNLNLFIAFAIIGKMVNLKEQIS